MNSKCQKPNFSLEVTNPKELCHQVKQDPELKQRFKQAMEKYKDELYQYFMCKLNRQLKESEQEAIKKAYLTAFEAHYCQFRKAGKREPYIIHPVEVALIVANEMGLDIIAIQAALLHDVLEDAAELFSYEDIKREFGEPVAITVDGVTKMTQLGGKSTNAKLETFKKMIYSISKEYRVILIKIADRLHNMRTMEGMPPEKQKIKSSENLYVYAQFAKAIGMFDIKNEMEDLSFKYLYPEIYKDLLQQDQKLKPYREKFLNDLKIELYKILDPLGYPIRIVTVERSLYEVWNKLKENPQLTFKDIHNRQSLRIIVDIDENEIHKAALQIFSTIASAPKITYQGDSWTDYISNPKSNGFKAIIFDVLYHHPETSDVLPPKAEIQILSKQDHIIAQKGANFESLQYRIKFQKQDESITDFIERVLRELETDHIYVYTPKGEIKRLPKGSSVLDFAFKIHTELGLHCIGARINYNTTKSPFYKLKSGEVVEVLHSKNIKPDLEWLEHVVTPKARNAILNYINSSAQTTKKPTQLKNKQITPSDKLPIVIDQYVNFKLAECCNPTPDSKAVAIQDENGNIIIHRADCTKLAALMSPEQIVPVIWNIKNSLYKINIKAMDRMGLLKDIANLISDELRLNMVEVHMKLNPSEHLVDGQLIVKVLHNNADKKCKNKKGCSPKDIQMLVKKLNNIDGIIDVQVQMKI